MAAAFMLLPLLQSAAMAQCYVPSLTPTEPNSPFSYASAFVEALSHAKEAETRATEKMSEVEMLVGLKRAKSDYECAVARLKPFTGSRVEAIETGSTAGVTIFETLAGLQDQKATHLVNMMNDVNDGTFQPGTAAETAAKIIASGDSAGQLLITAALATTYAVIELDPATGLMSRLAMTAVERDSLKQRLVATFGQTVVGGLTGGQSRLMAAAAVIYQVLNQDRIPRQK